MTGRHAANLSPPRRQHPGETRLDRRKKCCKNRACASVSPKRRRRLFDHSGFSPTSGGLSGERSIGSTTPPEEWASSASGLSSRRLPLATISSSGRHSLSGGSPDSEPHLIPRAPAPSSVSSSPSSSCARVPPGGVSTNTHSDECPQGAKPAGARGSSLPPTPSLLAPSLSLDGGAHTRESLEVGKCCPSTPALGSPSRWGPPTLSTRTDNPTIVPGGSATAPVQLARRPPHLPPSRHPWRALDLLVLSRNLPRWVFRPCFISEMRAARKGVKEAGKFSINQAHWPHSYKSSHRLSVEMRTPSSAGRWAPLSGQASLWSDHSPFGQSAAR